MVLAPKKDLGKTGCSEPVWSEEDPSSHPTGRGLSPPLKELKLRQKME